MASPTVPAKKTGLNCEPNFTEPNSPDKPTCELYMSTAGSPVPTMLVIRVMAPVAFKPLPRSSVAATVNSEPPLGPAPKVLSVPSTVSATSTRPEIVACACAPKTAAKAATATRVLILLVLINNKSNLEIDLLTI